MKVLVIGSGGREHAICWRLQQSDSVSNVYCTPGNPGVAMDASCIPARPNATAELAALADTLGVSFTVVGPENPLVDGIADAFRSRGLAIVGPSASAARLEGSKAFAKQFMRKHNIPTAEYREIDNIHDLRTHAADFGFPVAVKADGLAAGKGVVIAHSANEVIAAAGPMLSGEALAGAGRLVVLEQFLKGEELSFIVLSDGENYLALPPTQDHKPAFDGDTGPNTGGMGAYCIDSLLNDALRQRIYAEIIEPVFAGLRSDGISFNGFLYCGLMITADGPKVLEFNVRLGDPETQPLLYRMDGDFGELLGSAARGALDSSVISWPDDATACVVMASGGYPGAYEKNKAIDGIADAEAAGVKVFHAGTLLQQGRIVSSGGRVLGITARAATLQASLDAAYAGVRTIHFEGAHFRSDIGAKSL